MINDAGGVHGSKLRLVAGDDGNDGLQGCRNQEAMLYEKQHGFRLHQGNVGPPDGGVAVAIRSRAQGALVFWALDGRGLLRRNRPDRTSSIIGEQRGDGCSGALLRQGCGVCGRKQIDVSRLSGKRWRLRVRRSGLRRCVRSSGGTKPRSCGSTTKRNHCDCRRCWFFSRALRAHQIP